MREILFRGKLIDNGEWVEGSLVKSTYETPTKKEEHFRIQETVYGFNDESEMPFFCDYMSGIDEEVIPETVGQYTGLKDKNGNKIFEGDIVRYGNTIHKAIFEQRNGTAYFGLVYSEIETLPFGHYQDLKQIEVIGNIHDNPELIKE